LVLQVLDRLPDINAYPLQGAPWMENMIRDESIAFIGDAAHPTAGAYGMGCALAFCDVWALHRSLHRAHSSRLPTDASPSSLAALKSTISSTASSPLNSQQRHYDIPYALHLYNETRRYFLQRVQKQLTYDREDIEYCTEAIGDYDEYVQRYRETFTINWWMLEHDVDARWQEVEAEERHQYRKRAGQLMALL
jgi:salicylate hydroxylase